jgi:hypothetical protein
MPDDQNPLLRRAYLIRPRNELTTALRGSQLEKDDVEFLSRPVVSMTELLPYEGKLESYRVLIRGTARRHLFATFLSTYRWLTMKYAMHCWVKSSRSKDASIAGGPPRRSRR